jgi:hypothetical protein
MCGLSLGFKMIGFITLIKPYSLINARGADKNGRAGAYFCHDICLSCARLKRVLNIFQRLRRFCAM